MLSKFELRPFAFEGRSRGVYRYGEGPGVLVISEIPGITPKVSEFALRVAERGFQVWMPHLFGVPGKPPSTLYAIKSIAQTCISREFNLLATRRRSLVTQWLRALARALHAERPDDPGVGAVGMCLTGNFALSLMLDPCMQAPVLSQPSLPVALGERRRRAVHLDPGELETIAARSRDEDIPVLALRFTHDRMCPKARFDRLREAFGDRFEGIEIDSGPGNPHANPRFAHSVLTEHLVDERGHPTHEALERVLAVFEARLRPSSA